MKSFELEINVYKYDGFSNLYKLKRLFYFIEANMIAMDYFFSCESYLSLDSERQVWPVGDSIEIKG